MSNLRHCFCGKPMRTFTASIGVPSASTRWFQTCATDSCASFQWTAPAAAVGSVTGKRKFATTIAPPTAANTATATATATSTSTTGATATATAISPAKSRPRSKARTERSAACETIDLTQPLPLPLPLPLPVTLQSKPQPALSTATTASASSSLFSQLQLQQQLQQQQQITQQLTQPLSLSQSLSLSLAAAPAVHPFVDPTMLSLTRPRHRRRPEQLAHAYEADESLRSLRRTLFVFTDGSCPRNRAVHEAQNAQNAAGWSFLAVRPTHALLQQLHEASSSSSSSQDLHFFVAQHLRVAAAAEEVSRGFGPVLLSPGDWWLGAAVGSNNTGELSALLEALLFLLHHCPGTTKGTNEEEATETETAEEAVERVVLCYDSEYAAKSLSGEFDGSKNRALILRGRALLAQLRAQLAGNPRRTQSRPESAVQLVHVKAHNGHCFNEAADRLALLGAQQQLLRHNRFLRPPSSTASSTEEVQEEVVVQLGQQRVRLVPLATHLATHGLCE